MYIEEKPSLPWSYKEKLH